MAETVAASDFASGQNRPGNMIEPALRRSETSKPDVLPAWPNLGEE
jgi:hypothetical protein